MDKTKKWYLCDPRKNVNCQKRICYYRPVFTANRGRCRLTSDPQFAVNDMNGEPVEYGKARVPRVLSPDEIRQLPRGSVVWVEYFNGEEGRPRPGTSCAMKGGDGSLVDEELLVYDDFEKDMRPDDEGDCWRFWSAEPTPEDQATEPWPLKE